MIDDRVIGGLVLAGLTVAASAWQRREHLAALRRADLARLVVLIDPDETRRILERWEAAFEALGAALRAATPTMHDAGAALADLAYTFGPPDAGGGLTLDEILTEPPPVPDGELIEYKVRHVMGGALIDPACQRGRLI